MSTAEDRALAALSRIEREFQRVAAVAAEERSALERDCELLRAECDNLRRRLAGYDERGARLAAIVEQVEGRLDGAITQLDELAGG